MGSRGICLAALAATIAACTTTRTVATPTVTAPVADQNVMAMVRLAIEREPFGGAPDSLFSPTALFISNGRVRNIGPRYAGIGRGGTVRITGMTGDVTPPWAWVLVSYRWQSPEGTVSDGKATFLLQEIGARWSVRHVHSSLVLPWQGRDCSIRTDTPTCWPTASPTC